MALGVQKAQWAFYQNILESLSFGVLPFGRLSQRRLRVYFIAKWGQKWLKKLLIINLDVLPSSNFNWKYLYLTIITIIKYDVSSILKMSERFYPLLYIFLLSAMTRNEYHINTFYRSHDQLMIKVMSCSSKTPTWNFPSCIQLGCCHVEQQF